VSNDRPPDPGEAFRNLVTEWERGFDKLANNLMGTEGYSRSMNQLQDLQLGARRLFQDFMTQNLTVANMPTRDDVVRVAEAVQDLDRRLERIEAMLSAMTPSGASPAKTAAGPPRTKKPPSARKSSTSSEGDA
jgi:hypothetical protein